MHLKNLFLKYLTIILSTLVYSAHYRECVKVIRGQIKLFLSFDKLEFESNDPLDHADMRIAFEDFMKVSIDMIGSYSHVYMVRNDFFFFKIHNIVSFNILTHEECI